jgi:hypothetical protein
MTPKGRGTSDGLYLKMNYYFNELLARELEMNYWAAENGQQPS